MGTRREGPLLLKGQLVRATLDGQKTQTRRLVTRVAGLGPVREFQRSTTPGWDWIMRDRRGLWNDLRHADLLSRCPYGSVGDRLWVREEWWHYKSTELEMAGFIGGTVANLDGEGSRFHRNDDFSPEEHPHIWKKRPSIHMPRWASRLALDVIEVGVQRLQDITDDDARAEGMDWAAPHFFDESDHDDDREDPREVGYPPAGASFARDNFRRAWDHINGKRASWGANPWVWVITFARVVA